MKKSSIAFALLCIAGATFGQGSLTPPGAPAPTMKTLDELDASVTAVSNAVENIEARIDLATVGGDSSHDYFIFARGSYYLSSNIVVSKDVGIYVQAAGVSIDLNGFTITRTTPGGTGIYFRNGSDGSTLKNGTLRGFEKGVYCEANAMSLENLVVSECSLYGISTGISATLKSCRAVNNSGYGMSAGAGSTIENCIAENNGGISGFSFSVGCSVSDCIARNNAGNGIMASFGSTLTRCVAAENSSSGFNAQDDCILIGCTSRDNQANGFSISSGCSLTDCSTIENGWRGLYSTGTGNLTGCLAKGNDGTGLYLQSGSSLKDCTATGNGGQYGIFVSSAGSIIGCTASYNESSTYPNSAGIYAGEGSTIQECLAWENWNTDPELLQTLGVGIRVGAGSLVKDCQTAHNKGAGIYISDKSQAIGNHCDHNGLYTEGLGAGIYVSGGGNRIEDNHVSQNDFGLMILASTNLLVNNYANGNTDDFNITGIQISGGVSTNSGTISTTDSFANFEF